MVLYVLRSSLQAVSRWKSGFDTSIITVSKVDMQLLGDGNDVTRLHDPLIRGNRSMTRTSN